MEDSLSGKMGFVRQVPLVCPGHNRGIVELQYSEPVVDGLFLVSASHDGKPMLRNGETGDWIGTFEGHKGAVWGACINSDASLAATGAAEFSAKLWDGFSGDCKHTFAMKHICKSVALSEDSHYLLAAGNMPSLSIFDLHRPDAAPTLMEGGSRATKIARYIDAGSTLFMSAGSNPSMYIWDTRAAEAPVRTLPLSAEVKSGEMSRDGTFLTLVCADEKLHAFDMRKFECMKTLTLPPGTESASVHLERNRYVCGGHDLSVYMFDFETNQQLASHKGHHGPVWVVRFAPDGLHYSSGSDDGTIRIWATQPEPNSFIEVQGLSG
ncbi:Serine-threonine kinase receptor-associated protein [Porphyridium purpureum]|uniref:Serine-threonine kinase receptor-associated protein n=1 Tax=Porphyridium purpureum TaxID=35688 RepID=A0A5J4YW74_PORPP|nr:Serine-threonine kinase receptor-associated protein [Porphyridium purpureum]|eukprot:POR0999..scf209_3